MGMRVVVGWRSMRSVLQGEQRHIITSLSVVLLDAEDRFSDKPDRTILIFIDPAINRSDLEASGGIRTRDLRHGKTALFH